MAIDSLNPTEQFIEDLGLIAQADGLPRIAGKLIALFVVEGGPLGFSEIAERLQISRASVSTNTRLMESLGVLQRVTRPGERQDYFQLTDKPFVRLLEGTIDRAERARELVDRTNEQLGANCEATKERLCALGEFYKVLSSTASKVVDEISQRK